VSAVPSKHPRIAVSLMALMDQGSFDLDLRAIDLLNQPRQTSA
jgi:hypothetical protein